MFTVFSIREGKKFQHHVKPLKVIWAHFPQCGPENTIHIDDLVGRRAANMSKLARLIVRYPLTQGP